MTIAGITFVLVFMMMTAAWVVSRRLNDVSIVDILWAPAFAVFAVASALVAGVNTRGLIVLALVVVWAIRLGSHIFARWRRLGREDYRYTEIRRKRGGNFAMTSLYWIFWMQALLLWVISWPLQAAIAFQRPLNRLDWVGVTLAIAGIVIEAVADSQLTRFRADPANRERVLSTGIWRWSRHPNYFGDFTLWWGLFLIALAAGAPWWLVLSPIAMSALLIHYSGAGLMEDTIATRRPGYAEYIKRTSLFVPLPPKS